MRQTTTRGYSGILFITIYYEGISLFIRDAYNRICFQ
jgi:hypothetical protein